MDTKQVYETVMMEYYLAKMKRLRNSWIGNRTEKKIGLATLIDVEGHEQRQYRGIMDQCNDYIYEMLGHVIKALLKAYNIPVQCYDLRCSTAYSYYGCEERYFLDYMDQHDEKNVLCFNRKDQEVLFIFKKFGIRNDIPQKTIDDLLKTTKLKTFCYISYVEKEAFSEVINHNDDENDPSRGTNKYSLKQFFEGFFGIDEYLLFREYADEFTQKVRDYFGFELVRTIKPNTLHNFRGSVRYDLLNLNSQISQLLVNISEEQKKILDEHFFAQKNYELLLGKNDFAQSFMTAEWLYTSLSNAGNIDLTAIAMGYFKAIEQLLFSFIKLHTYEKDHVNRKIYTGKNDPNADQKGNATLTNTLINDEDRTKKLTLSSLTGFFGHYNDRTNSYVGRNQDILNNGINGMTYEFIIDTFDGVVGLRNGYFHKDNLSDWQKVESARNKALTVFYLLFGAYRISADDRRELGLILVDEHDDFYKLCDYINQKAYDSSMLTKPIFYFEDINDPNDYVFPRADNYIEYDNYGEPIYSGIYFSRKGQREWSKKITREEVPTEIWEGVFTITRDLEYLVSGPQKKIFDNGTFLAEME